MQMKTLPMIAAALFWSNAAWSIDLVQAFGAASQYDAAFASARASLQAARERTLQADALTRPTLGLNAGASANYANNKFEGTPSASTNYNSSNAGLQGSLPLYRPANNVQQDQSKLSERIAEAQFLQARQDLIVRLSQAYFDVLNAQDTLTSIGAQKVAVTEQLAQAKREFEVGTKTIVDTTEAQARFDQISSLEATAQGDLQIRRSALAQITGIANPEISGLVAKPALRPPEPALIEDWTGAAEKGNPGVTANDLAAQVAKLEIDRNKASYKPTVDLVSNIGLSYATGSVQTDRNISGRSATIGVQFNMPLYSGGAIDARVREALALEERARFDLESARRNANQGARSAFFGVTFGLAQVKALEAAEVSANSQLSATRLGYQVGVRINLEVLNAQQQLANTRRDLAKARYDTLLAGLRLKAAAGQLTEEDLKPVNAYLDAAAR
jgi:outer membrane protein